MTGLARLTAWSSLKNLLRMNFVLGDTEAMSDDGNSEETRKETKSLALPLAGLVAAGVIGSAELGRRLFRDTRLFDPTPTPLRGWDPASYGFDPAMTDVLEFEGHGVELHGWYCRTRNPRASVLFCHGKAGNLTWFTDGVRALVAADLNVLTFDYRGFGRSSGRPSIRGVVRDAVVAAREHERLRPAELPSILWGYSLGGAIGARAFLEEPFDGVVLQSTFTSLPEITRLHFPGTPLHLLAGNLYDTLDFVRDLEVPMLIVHGDRDETVPVEMGRTLHRSCAKSTLLEIEGGMHRNLFEVAGDQICGAVSEFVDVVDEHRSLTAAAVAPGPAPSPATPAA